MVYVGNLYEDLGVISDFLIIAEVDNLDTCLVGTLVYFRNSRSE
jgi:hypothetical protein